MAWLAAPHAGAPRRRLPHHRKDASAEEALFACAQHAPPSSTGWHAPSARSLPRPRSVPRLASPPNSAALLNAAHASFAIIVLRCLLPSCRARQTECRGKQYSAAQGGTRQVVQCARIPRLRDTERPGGGCIGWAITFRCSARAQLRGWKCAGVRRDDGRTLDSWRQPDKPSPLCDAHLGGQRCAWEVNPTSLHGNALGEPRAGFS